MRSPETTSWHSASWQAKPAQQQPVYQDPAALERVVAELSRLPPIVVSWEIEALRERLAAAQRGEAFLLQGGDCAETFADCESDTIAKKLKILLQMSLVLLHGLKKPIIRVGRMAGQYAKPRSADTETRDGVTLPSYRGDLVNRPEFTRRGARRRSGAAAARLRARRADAEFRPRAGRRRLRRPAPPGVLGPRVRASTRRSKDAYQRIVELDRRRARLLRGHQRACRCTRRRRVDFYASHEGLHLLYEQAQTRFIPRQNRWYNLRRTCPWIGMRTAQLDGAHVEYFRGISNPDRRQGRPGDGRRHGCRAWSTTLDPQNAARAAHADPPLRRQGHREQRCRALIEAVRADRPARCCGSAIRCTATPRPRTGGLKTRRFDNILNELELAFRIHARAGLVPRRRAHRAHRRGRHRVHRRRARPHRGGPRSAPTGRSVDPRLNHEQALELAMLIAERSQIRRADKRPGAVRALTTRHAIRAHRRPCRGGADHGSMPTAH